MKRGVVYVDSQAAYDRAWKAAARPIELSESEYYNELKRGTYDRSKYTFSNVVVRFKP